MAQHDFTIDNAPGAAVRSDINAVLQAILSSSSGPVEPTVRAPGTLWMDTSVSGQTILRIRNKDDTGWDQVGLSSSALFLPLAGGTMLGDLVLDDDPSLPLHPVTKQYHDAGQYGAGNTVAAASTTDIAGSSAVFNFVTVTGTPAINSFGNTPFRMKVIYWSGSGATVNNSAAIVLPGGAPLTPLAGDVWTLFFDGSGNAHVLAKEPIDGSVKGSSLDVVGNGDVRGGTLTVYSDDPGAGGLPNLVLRRTSPSPAGSDQIGGVYFQGANTSLQSVTYGGIIGRIITPATGAHAGSLGFYLSGSGSFDEVARITAGSNLDNAHFDFANPTIIDPSASAFGLSTLGLGQLRIASNTSATLLLKSNVNVYVQFYSGGTVVGNITQSGGVVSYNSFMGSHWSRFDGDADATGLLRGTILETVDAMVEWIGFEWTDHLGERHTVDALPDGFHMVPGEAFDYPETWTERQPVTRTVTVVKRIDGVVQVDDDGEAITEEQTITEEQDVEMTRKAPAVCVVLDNQTLPAVKFAESGSPSVYGVFSRLDADGDIEVSALGAFVVRMKAGEEVARGDLVESAGGGVGRVMRDKTLSAIEVEQRRVAKVTSSKVQETYPDGSFLVAATIHCG